MVTAFTLVCITFIDDSYSQAPPLQSLTTHNAADFSKLIFAVAGFITYLFMAQLQKNEFFDHLK